MMGPKQSIALWAALLVPACAEGDTTSLLQKPVRRQPLHVGKKEVHLLETAQILVSKVNEGDDPSGCGAVSDAARTAVEEALPAIFQQYTHLSNEIQIVAQAVETCSAQGGDLAQQGIDLEALRSSHQTCRLAEHDLEGGIEVCQQYAELRNSLQNRCFSFPNDEGGFPDAVQQSRDELDVAFNQAVLLRDQCNSARQALALEHAECVLAQHMFEEDFCVYRANCAGVQACRANTEEAYHQTEAEVQVALETLHSEYQVLKHVECLLGHADQALEQNTIISGDAVGACSEPASTNGLTINFPSFDALTTCEPSIISHPPCGADFFAAEYSNLPQREAIQAACIECPALPGAEAPFTADDLVCGAGSPDGCHCSQVQLQGLYSAGPVIRCDDGIDVHHTTDQNSCPSGWKIFSPQSQADWEVLHSALGDHSHGIGSPAGVQSNWPSSPWLIVDVSRSDSTVLGGMGQLPAMNSANSGAAAWHTSDGSPFWLREAAWNQPDGSYIANCFLDIFDVNPGAMGFDDHNCVPHSSSYLCQHAQHRL